MKKGIFNIKTLALLTAVLIAVFTTAIFAEGTGVTATNSSEASYEIEDTNPAIHVAQRNVNSVVGVITMVESWDRYTREVTEEIYSEGSGVVIADNGYVITNYHVVSGGDFYNVLMPSGETVDAEMVGYDSSVDLAVLKVSDEYAAELVPAAIGSVDKVFVGSTVIAIGNPGGQTLSNTVTSGIISCLERAVDGGNTSRTVEYIQHDASISSGNSGGGLFDVNGNLIGINTLKYSSSGYYGSGSYEGLGFAIPVDTAFDVAVQIIEQGHVRRIGIGVTVQEADGAEEPTEEETPAGLYIVGLTKDGPAYKAGVQEGDFLIAINGERVKQMEDLTDVIDELNEGDTVTVTVARYVEEGAADREHESDFNSTGFEPASSYGFPFGFPFGGYFGDYDDYYPDYYNQPAYELEIIDFEIVLEYLN